MAGTTHENRRALPGITYPAGVRSPAQLQETTLAYAVPLVKRKVRMRKVRREQKVPSGDGTAIRSPAAPVALAS